jgi:hypothetical protein
MSERRTADLLEMEQKHLNRVRGNRHPKPLKPFIDNGLSVRGKVVELVAENRPHCHRKIVSSGGIAGATFSNIIPKRRKCFNRDNPTAHLPTIFISFFKIGNTFI